MTVTSTVDVKKALSASTGSGSGGLGIDIITATLKTSYHPYAVGAPVTVIPPPAKPVTRKIPTQHKKQIEIATYLLTRASWAFDTYTTVVGNHRRAAPRTLSQLAPGATFHVVRSHSRGTGRGAHSASFGRRASRSARAPAAGTCCG
jgi:hypothetical protein